MNLGGDCKWKKRDFFPAPRRAWSETRVHWAFSAPRNVANASQRRSVSDLNRRRMMVLRATGASEVWRKNELYSSALAISSEVSDARGSVTFTVFSSGPELKWISPRCNSTNDCAMLSPSPQPSTARPAERSPR